MKLSWRDLITTLLAVAGGTIVYAKFYNYSWALIGSWRGSVAALTVVGALMFAFSKFNFSNMSWMNLTEMLLGFIAAALAVTGIIATSEPIFYILAIFLGVLWAMDTARHIRHSVIHENTTSFHRHIPAH